MAENLNENGLAPNDVEINQYYVNSPAVSESEYQAGYNIAKINNPVILDIEYQPLTSKVKLSSTGLSIGEDAGQNFSMFL